jgi:hypothetical protein
MIHAHVVVVRSSNGAAGQEIKMPTKEEKEAYLTSRDWSTWYNPKYWVHIEIDKRLTNAVGDYTAFGSDLDGAYALEKEYEKTGKSRILGGIHPYAMRYI